MVIYRCSVVEGQENKVVVGCGWRALESEAPQCLVQTGVKIQSLGDWWHRVDEMPKFQGLDEIQQFV